MRVCVCYVWVAAYVYLWLNLLLRLISCAFCMFLCIMHFALIRVWVCVFSVITVLCLFFECLSVFVAEATFLAKSKLSWCNCLWTVQKCVFVYTCVVFVCVLVCPQERAIKGVVWWRDCIKGAREETEWQAAERAACGGDCTWGTDAGA